MNSPSVRNHLNGTLFFFLVVLVAVMEFYGQVLERGVGYYLKWHNHDRPQLGRMWERDRDKMVAQKKIESILSSLNLKETSSESIQSFRQLFERLNPSFPQLVSRKKFLHLYFDFPGRWTEKVISPFELIEIDANKNWRRVLLTRFGPWITMSFIDNQNYPVREVFVSLERLGEVASHRKIQDGTLEEAGFTPENIFRLQDFLPVLKNLDPENQKALFPDPQWFLSKDFHVTRVGSREGEGNVQSPVQFGIEYEGDFLTHVLIIPVPRETANNLLSQIERPVLEDAEGVGGPLESLREGLQ